MNTPASSKPSLLHLGNQTTYVLEDTTIIGRHEDCNLVLITERGASRKHARITIENNTAVLMDLGSLNGTMVNGREIGRPVQLTDGDIVVFDQQEYLFVGAATTEQLAGDNVTVIANKDEIGRPESIRPAIRVVDTPEPAQVAQPPAAQTPAVQTPAAEAQPGHADNPQSFDDTEAWEIPATSRPGGDAVTPKRLQKQYNQPRTPKGKRPVWLSWVVIVPILLLLMLIAFYFAYTTGFSAGTAGTTTESS